MGYDWGSVGDIQNQWGAIEAQWSSVGLRLNGRSFGLNEHQWVSLRLCKGQWGSVRLVGAQWRTLGVGRGSLELRRTH